MRRPTPRSTARDFRIDEMFFSTTDRRGVILAGNDVFARVSGYPRDELIGARHNIIRHPDMPRAVFRLVWDYLLRGQPVAGLVKNMAQDGQFYWVVAFLMPVPAGFLSLRFKPSSPFLGVVEGLYRDMLACEGECEARGDDGTTTMDASSALLVRALAAAGFDGYDAFMCTLLREELKCRDAGIADVGGRLFPRTLTLADDGDAWGPGLQRIFASNLRAYEQANGLYVRLDDFAELSGRLAGKSGRVVEMTDEFGFIAVNASLRSRRLGHEGRSLGVLAAHLAGESKRTRLLMAGLSTQIAGISTRLRDVMFRLAAARLQLEMVLMFATELAQGGAESDPLAADADARQRHAMIGELQGAFADTIEFAVRSLRDLDHDLATLGGNAAELKRIIHTLQFVQMGGLIEANRLQHARSFSAMFADLRDRIERTKVELLDLNAISARLGLLAGEAPRAAEHIAADVEEMRRAVASLAGVRRRVPGGGAAQGLDGVEGTSMFGIHEERYAAAGACVDYGHASS